MPISFKESELKETIVLLLYKTVVGIALDVILSLSENNCVVLFMNVGCSIVVFPNGPVIFSIGEGNKVE